jgi:hypothetical protein
LRRTARRRAQCATARRSCRTPPQPPTATILHVVEMSLIVSVCSLLLPGEFKADLCRDAACGAGAGRTVGAYAVGCTQGYCSTALVGRGGGGGGTSKGPRRGPRLTT